MKPRDRLVLTVLGVAGALGALWFFVVTPKREEAKALTAQVTVAEQRRTTALAQAAVAEQAKASYRSDYATVARLGKAVPVHADVPSLVYQLETAARHAKVDFRSINVQSAAATAPAPAPPTPAKEPAEGEEAPTPGATAPPAPATSGIEPKAFQFTFQGDFFSLRRLLSEIDRFSHVKSSGVSVSGRLLTIDTVSLNPSPKGLPNIKAEIKANAYVAVLPAALPGAPSPQVGAGATAPTTTTASQVAP